MTKVTIFTRLGCPYCSRALALLKDKGADFDEIDAGSDPSRKAEMIEKAGGARTFPQIFIGGVHIGGCDDMLALDRVGKLDPLLAQA